MKRLLALGLAAICLACALPLTACTPQQKLYSASWFDMFDTVTMVQGYAASQEEWDTQADALHDDLEHYHQLFDIYHHYDGMVNLYDVNARPGTAPRTPAAAIQPKVPAAPAHTVRTDGMRPAALLATSFANSCT